MESEFNTMMSVDDEEHGERSGLLASVDEINRLNDTIRRSGANINARVNDGELPLEFFSLHSSENILE